MEFVSKVMSLLFNMLSRLALAFLPKSKHLLISWMQSPSAVILEPKKIKSVTVSIVSPSLCHEVIEPDAMIVVFWMLSFKPSFSLSSFTFFKRLLFLDNFNCVSQVKTVTNNKERIDISRKMSHFPIIWHENNVWIQGQVDVVNRYQMLRRCGER